MIFLQRHALVRRTFAARKRCATADSSCVSFRKSRACWLPRSSAQTAAVIYPQLGRGGGLLYNIFINFFFFFGVLLFRFLSFSHPIAGAARPICMYVFRNYYSSSSRRHRRPPPPRANYQVNIRARYTLAQPCKEPLRERRKAHASFIVNGPTPLPRRTKRSTHKFLPSRT